MAGNLRVCVLAAAGFFLLFLWAVLITERHKYRISSLLAEKFPFLRKVPWDTLIKGLVIAGFILFVKKVLYYLVSFNCIQTPASVWWIDPQMMGGLCYFSIWHIGVIMSVVFNRSLNYYFPKKTAIEMVLIVVIVLFLVAILIQRGLIPIEIRRVISGLSVLFLTVLFFLKMLCTGKYLGLLTGFMVGSYIVDRYKKLKSKVKKKNAKFLKVPGLIIAVAWALSFFYFTRDPQSIFQDKIRAAKSEAAVEEFMDAVHSITDSPTKATALREILWAIHLPWNRETLQQAIEETIAIESNIDKARILKDLALVIARTGDRKWAESIADSIKNPGIKKEAFEKISKFKDNK
jgi:hypothetical protein